MIAVLNTLVMHNYVNYMDYLRK